MQGWEFIRNFATQISGTDSAPLTSSGGYQSGQMGQTVNLLVYTFGGSNPSPPTYDINSIIAHNDLLRRIREDAPLFFYNHTMPDPEYSFGDL